MELNLRARLRDGDPDAFKVLFDDHAGAVYNLAFRLTGSWHEAEEILSLTFLEAWRLRARLEPDGESPRPWLLGIADAPGAGEHTDAIRRELGPGSRSGPA